MQGLKRHENARLCQSGRTFTISAPQRESPALRSPCGSRCGAGLLGDDDKPKSPLNDLLTSLE